MVAISVARRRFEGPQNGSYRLSREAVEDNNEQKAADVVVGIEQARLLHHLHQMASSGQYRG